VRGRVWAAILKVHGSCSAYDAFDTVSEHPSDAQLDKDIPRCHQYHPVLASPQGRMRLRNVLKCWVSANPSLVYWQGLDSLAAPFVCLDPDNEGMAYCCLHQLVKRYVHDLFLPDNSVELQHRMWSFSMLLVWHDPQLALHLTRLNFQPELYTIPWFLTLFAHVLPLDKTFALWDAILLQPPAFSMHVALGVTRQFREELLRSDFNQCVLFFSRNVASVRVSACIEEALWSQRVAPPSVACHPVRGVSMAEAKGGSPGDDAPEDHREDPLDAAFEEKYRQEHDQEDRPWWKQPLTVEEQRCQAYRSPSIDVLDLIPQLDADRKEVHGVLDNSPDEAAQRCSDEYPLSEAVRPPRWRYLAIDVRSAEAFATSHLAGSVHVAWKAVPAQPMPEEQIPGMTRDPVRSNSGSTPGGAADEGMDEVALCRVQQLLEEFKERTRPGFPAGRVATAIATSLGDDSQAVAEPELPSPTGGSLRGRGLGQAQSPPHVAEPRPEQVFGLVIIGDRGPAASECAAMLVAAAVPYVAVLSGGFESIEMLPESSEITVSDVAGLSVPLA